MCVGRGFDPRSLRYASHALQRIHGGHYGRCVDSHARRNDSSAALNACACDTFSPCGAPLTVTSLLWRTTLWVRWPEPSMGTIASASPWITSVGTFTCFRSSRKSVVANESMQANAACCADWRHRAIASPRCDSVTCSAPLAEKKSLVNWSKKELRSCSSAFLICCAFSGVSGPCGLSAVFIRYGGTAAANTTLCRRDSPYLAMLRVTAPPPTEKPTS